MSNLLLCWGKESSRLPEKAEESAKRKKVGAYKRLKKWAIKHFQFWRKQKKQKTTDNETISEVSSEIEEREQNTASIPNVPTLISCATIETEDVPCASEESTVDGIESVEKTANIEKSSEGSALSRFRDDTSQASTSSSSSSSTSSDESSEYDSDCESKNYITELSEDNVDICINDFIEKLMTENTRLKTSYLLTPTEPEVENYFTVGHKIAKGGFASVRKGKWTLRQSNGEVMTKNVAIKIIKHNNNLKQLSLSAHELKALTRCKHPNIVELHFILIYGRRTLLGIELASRGDLSDYLQEEGPLLEGQARILFNQTVDAVRYCHVNGIAHRDIKSRNILLDHKMSVKLTDFGLSIVQPNPDKITAEQFKTDVCCGTLPYMAPEIFRGIMYDSRKCDVWSLGILLYEMLTSIYPFSNRNILIMAEKLSKENLADPDYFYLARKLYKRPTFPPRLSKPVRGLILTMLRMKPKYRANISKVQHHYWLAKNGEPES